MEVGWYYEFYKVYKTNPEDVSLWEGKDASLLPDHLWFFSSKSGIDLSEIGGYLEPITMVEEGQTLDGYLGTLYQVASFGRDAYEVKYKSPRSAWFRFVKLTNSHAKRMIRYAWGLYDRPEEALMGYLGKKSEYKSYPGKLRNVVFFECQ